eukprot:g10274.t1
MSGPLRDLSNLGLSVRCAAGHSSDRGHAFAVVGATKAARKHEEKQKVKEEQEGRGGLERPTPYSQTQACRVGGDYDRIDPLLVVLCRRGRCCCNDEAVLPTTAAVDEVVPFEAGDDSEDEGDVEMVEPPYEIVDMEALREGKGHALTPEVKQNCTMTDSHEFYSGGSPAARWESRRRAYPLSYCIMLASADLDPDEWIIIRLLEGFAELTPTSWVLVKTWAWLDVVLRAS